MTVYNNFDAQTLLFICLEISPQVFAILQNFPINNLRDQQFCTLLCELERPVVVLFTGNALEVELPPGIVWSHIYQFAASQQSADWLAGKRLGGGAGFMGRLSTTEMLS